MNLTTDLLERFPASKPALVTISAEGERRVWHFGELIARSAGLSGGLAARGVGRGDVVMTLVGNRIEWVLTLLACWRMGAIALPCSTQLRRGDLEHRVAATGPALCVGEDELLADLPAEVERMTLDEVWAVLDEDRAQAPPVEPADLGPEDGALDRLHLRDDREAARRPPRPALPARSGGAGPPVARRRRGRARLVHDRDRLVEIGAKRLPRPLARAALPRSSSRGASTRRSGSSSASARG